MATDRVDRIIEQWGEVRPDLDVTAMGVVGRITRLAHLVQRELETVFGDYGFMRGDFDVLATLRRAGTPDGLTPGRLCRSTMASTGGMTKILDRLESRGLLRREPDPDDRRGRLIVLTPEGIELADEILDRHVRNLDRLAASLPPDQREQLAALLRAFLIEVEGPAD